MECDDCRMRYLFFTDTLSILCYARYMNMTYASSATQVRNFISRTYSWMSAGLVLTAAIAYITAQNPEIAASVMQWRFPLFIAQLGLVFGMSLFSNRLGAVLTGLLFIAYATLTGLTFSGLLMSYSSSAVYSAFLSTAGTFGVMSAVGLFVKKDLSAIGRFALFAIIGLIIASIVNIFMANSLLSLVISVVGIVLFAGLTAYDTQKLKEMALSGVSGEEAEKGAIHGALMLYLDFVNMFLYMLRLFSGDRD